MSGKIKIKIRRDALCGRESMMVEPGRNKGGSAVMRGFVGGSGVVSGGLEWTRVKGMNRG